MRDVFEIAGQAVKGIGHDDIEEAAARVLEQLLLAGSQMRRPAHRAIVIGMEIGPAFSRNAFLTHLDLIID